jgi:hypothetical protein
MIHLYITETNQSAFGAAKLGGIVGLGMMKIVIGFKLRRYWGNEYG